MKRVVLTGGSGFVGANLARRLLRDGHTVHLMLRSNHAPWRVNEIRDDVSCHEGDLCDSDIIAKHLSEIRPDWVFNLAAHGAYSTQTDLQEMVRTNFTGTVNLLQACRDVGIESFVHAGTSSEYGYKDHPPCETEVLEPNSDYAVTKASATQYCRYAAQQTNFPVRTLRLYSVYGPYEEPTRLMPTLILSARNQQWPPLASPEIARDFIYVDDVCEAFIRAAESRTADSGGIYNVGTGKQSTLKHVVDLTGDLLRVTSSPTWETMAARRWDTNTWVADNSLIAAELDWTPTTSLQEGLRRFAEWFERNPVCRQYYCEALGIE